MMRRSIAALVLVVLLVGSGLAQSTSPDSSMARRLASVLGDVQVDESKGVGLSDLAAEIDLALIDVDPDQVATLNDELAELERQERDLLDRLGDLESGLPVIIGPVEFEEPNIGDVSEAALELARVELSAQQAEIERLERLDRERETQVAAERAARRKTPLSSAMLQTLDEIPTVAETTVSTVEEPTSEFPLRVARALFVSDDYIGALRQFRAVPDDAMSFRARFEMARCLEETNGSDEAIKVLDALIARAGESETFWRERAASLKRLIESSRNIRALARER